MESQSEKSVVSQEFEEVAGEVVGNPSPDDFQGSDFFIYQKIVCINAINIDWINEMALTEGELLGEIKKPELRRITQIGTQLFCRSVRKFINMQKDMMY